MQAQLMERGERVREAIAGIIQQQIEREQEAIRLADRCLAEGGKVVQHSKIAGLYDNLCVQ